MTGSTNVATVEIWQICSGHVRGSNFVCDPSKRLANVQKHAIDLIRASEVFFDPFAISNFDGDHSGQEDRYSIIGKMENEKLAYVVYALRGEVVRLISARKATSREAHEYAKR